MAKYVYQASPMTHRDLDTFPVGGGSAGLDESFPTSSFRMRTASLLGTVLLVSVLLSGCAQNTAPEPKEAAAPVERSLLNPASLNEKAPDQFMARFETNKGVFRVEVTRVAAPIGVDRFYNLVKNGFYNGARFVCVMPTYVAFGLKGDPAIDAAWREQEMKDDPATRTNRKGTIAFTPLERPNARTTYLWINLTSNGYLDDHGYAPFGSIVEGMEVVESLYGGYGPNPEIPKVLEEGNDYLTKEFPRLDYIETAAIE